MYRDDREALMARVGVLEADLKAEGARRSAAEAKLAEALARDYEDLIDTKVLRRRPKNRSVVTFLDMLLGERQSGAPFTLLLPRRPALLLLLLASAVMMVLAIGTGLAVRWLRMSERQSPMVERSVTRGSQGTPSRR